MLKYNKKLKCQVEFVQILLVQELKIRYGRSVLGFFWSLLAPALTMLVMTTIFSTLWDWPFWNFMLFLFSAYLPWRFFSSSITTSVACMTKYEKFVKQISLPNILFPITITLSSLIDYLLASIVLYIVLLFFAGNISLSLIILPYAIIITYFTTLGFSLLVAAIGTFFRDLQHIIVIIFQAWFYCTPIIYSEERIAKLGERIGLDFNPMELNPISYLIHLFRAPIHEGTFPLASDFIISLILALASFITGLVVFQLSSKRFVFRL